MIAGVILAGGLSRRMGGGDKPLMDLCGRPVIAHIIDRMRPQVGALAINANGDPARFARFGLPVLPDPLPGNPGPLAGILAGMLWAADMGADGLLTVPGDTPFLPADLAQRLTPGPAIAESHGRAHPVVGLWPVSAQQTDVARLRALLEHGERRAMVWAANARRERFDARPDPFANLNTPQDLANARNRLSF